MLWASPVKQLRLADEKLEKWERYGSIIQQKIFFIAMFLMELQQDFYSSL